jgi:WhiB family transcriptional regulator, redox-sensing transcriptional regulator
MTQEPVPGLSMGSYAAHGNSNTVINPTYRSNLNGWGLPQPWEKQAVCQDTPIELWFGAERPFGDKRQQRTKGQTAQAKAICARCPVLDACRQWTLESRIPFGIVGGWTEAERREILYGKRPPRAPSTRRRTVERVCLACGGTFQTWKPYQHCCSRSCAGQLRQPPRKRRPTSAQHHNASKTHCPRGHPYSPENTYVAKRGRDCIACKKRRNAEYWQRKRQAD